MPEALRIAYLTPYGASYTSISTHTNRRMLEWERNGATVCQFLIGDDQRQCRGALRNLALDWSRRNSTLTSLREWSPDLIYVRWLTPVPGLLRAASNIAPIVLDVHADDLVAVAGNSRLRRWYLRATRGREIGTASAITFVVSELGSSEGFSSLSLPTASFPNGSWVDRRATTSSGRKVVGISVGSPNPSAGLDRFSALAEGLSSEADWVVACPATAEDAVRASVSSPVRVLGTSTHDDYISEVSRWSIAIGSLALERTGLQSAAPLKVRDYVGIGVPTILPYWDEGLEGIDDPLILKAVAQHEPPITSLPQTLVLDMLERAHGRDLLMATSRAVAGSHIEQRRLAFLRGILASGR